MEAESGTQKVKKWLETVEIPEVEQKSAKKTCNEVSMHKTNIEIDKEKGEVAEFKFKSVKRIVESFSSRDCDKRAHVVMRGNKIFDNCLVRAQVDSYNTLEKNKNTFKPRVSLLPLISSNETDSGIESSLRTTEKLPTKSIFFRHQFSRDGELV
jgi:hypothetical protein